MKIVQINATCGKGSTGKICVDISRLLTERNIENYILYTGDTSEYPLGVCYADRWQIKTEALRSHMNGLYGFNSRRITNNLLRQLDAIQPDLVHLHNLHGHNCNLEMLSHYLKEKHIKVFWTFHDCWAFTAYCPHFTMAKCEKWKTGCESCPQYHDFSFWIDRSEALYHKKLELLVGLDLTIITPSQWLADLVKQSFLQTYPVKVINNGIDLDVFKPTLSDFREKYHIPQDCAVLLGVAFDWGRRKGLDVFAELAKRLDPEKYQIVLVGTNDRIDRSLPPQIISIHRTHNQQELAEIYTAADLFVNPTREDNYPTVNMESIACGTPVLTFDTGGSPEIIDEKSGSVVRYNDIEALGREIIRICEKNCYEKEHLLFKAQEFNRNKRLSEYCHVYGFDNKEM